MKEEIIKHVPGKIGRQCPYDGGKETPTYIHTGGKRVDVKNISGTDFIKWIKTVYPLSPDYMNAEFYNNMKFKRKMLDEAVRYWSERLVFEFKAKGYRGFPVH